MMKLLYALGPKGVEGFINFFWTLQPAEVLFLRIQGELYRRTREDLLDRTRVDDFST